MQKSDEGRAGTIEWHSTVPPGEGGRQRAVGMRGGVVRVLQHPMCAISFDSWVATVRQPNPLPRTAKANLLVSCPPPPKFPTVYRYHFLS